MDERVAKAKAEKRAKKKEEARKAAGLGDESDPQKEEPPVKEGTKEERQKARALAKRQERRPRTPLELVLQRLEEERTRMDVMMKQVCVCAADSWLGVGKGK